MTLDFFALNQILRAYGYFGLDTSILINLKDKIRMGSSKEDFEDITVQTFEESAKHLYYSSRPENLLSGLFMRRRPVYHALLSHISFIGKNIEPIWVNNYGRAVIAWLHADGKKTLLVGLNVEEEIILYRQGDPEKVRTTPHEERTQGNFPHERPYYLFNDHVVPEFKTLPWADYLGFFLAETFSKLSGIPLIEVLPDGVKGAILLTGDDDQADLDRYQRQLEIIQDFPVTYFLHHLTKHTPATLKEMPVNVQFGLHPDGLEQPELYDELCEEQYHKVKNLVYGPLRAVRNHGFQNRGYLGYLDIWEKLGLVFHLNYPAHDGTAFTGSFIPMHIRRQKGIWSDHYSLLTAVTDGIIIQFNKSESDTINILSGLVRQIESTNPGVLALNFHPQNIIHTEKIHSYILSIGRRRGWTSMGLNTYLQWLESLQNLRIELLEESKIKLYSRETVSHLVLRSYFKGRWRKHKLEEWIGQKEISINFSVI